MQVGVNIFSHNAVPATRAGLLYLQKETAMKTKSIKSDLARIDRMRDRDIDYSDIPPLDQSFLKKAVLAFPPVKKQPETQPPTSCSSAPPAAAGTRNPQTSS
jgi:hypothetical protein